MSKRLRASSASWRDMASAVVGDSPRGLNQTADHDTFIEDIRQDTMDMVDRQLNRLIQAAELSASSKSNPNGAGASSSNGVNGGESSEAQVKRLNDELFQLRQKLAEEQRKNHKHSGDLMKMRAGFLDVEGLDREAVKRAIDWDTSSVPKEDDIRLRDGEDGATGSKDGKSKKRGSSRSSFLSGLMGEKPSPRAKGFGHVDAVIDAVCAGLRNYRNKGSKDLQEDFLVVIELQLAHGIMDWEGGEWNVFCGFHMKLLSDSRDWYLNFVFPERGFRVMVAWCKKAEDGGEEA